MSRTSAKKNLNLEKVKSDLEKHGVYLEAGSNKGILEEAPEAYKDVNEVVRVSDELGIGKVVAINLSTLVRKFICNNYINSLLFES